MSKSYHPANLHSNRSTAENRSWISVMQNITVRMEMYISKCEIMKMIDYWPNDDAEAILGSWVPMPFSQIYSSVGFYLLWKIDYEEIAKIPEMSYDYFHIFRMKRIQKYQTGSTVLNWKSITSLVYIHFKRIKKKKTHIDSSIHAIHFHLKSTVFGVSNDPKTFNLMESIEDKWILNILHLKFYYRKCCV